MRHRKHVLVAVALLAWLGAGFQKASAQFPKETGEIQQKDGNTTATATAKVSKQADKGLIELRVKVKKTGPNGKGFAYGQVALLDKDNNTIFKTDVLQKHKGASAFKGIANGETFEDYEVPLEVLNNTAKAVLIVRAKDDDGLRDPVGSLKKHLDDALEILKRGNDVKEEFIKLVGF